MKDNKISKINVEVIENTELTEEVIQASERPEELPEDFITANVVEKMENIEVDKN